MLFVVDIWCICILVFWGFFWLIWSHVNGYLWQSIRVAEKITQKVEGQLSKSQKEFLLRQQVSFLTIYIQLFIIYIYIYIYRYIGVKRVRYIHKLFPSTLLSLVQMFLNGALVPMAPVPIIVKVDRWIFHFNFVGYLLLMS